MPSASSTSARAGLRRRRPVAVLDHPGAGTGGHDRRHRRDVDRHRAVAAGADDVEQPPGHRDRRGAAASIASTRPVTSSMVSPLARSATAKPAIWAGVASPAEHLAHRPGGLGGVEVGAGDEGARGPPASCGSRRHGAQAGTRERSSATTASASRIGSIGCGTAASARDQVASQASCGRPVSTRTGGQLVDLVLELLGDAHAAGGHGLAVEDRQRRCRRRPCSG